MRVAAISGRSRERTRAVAEELSGQLGHEVRPHDSAQSLLASGVGAVVIASPPEAHLEALQLALQAGIPCLCEKPLFAPDQLAAATAILDAFAEQRLLLVENCQWPYVLPAFDALFPEVRERPVERLAMRMSPSALGWEMLPDSLPHVLSMVDALVPVAAEVSIENVGLLGQPEAGFGERENHVQIGWQVEGRRLLVDLHLRHAASQPRPAWVAIDGRRMDRRIGPDYAIAFADSAAADRAVAADDPLGLLVEDFHSRLARFRADGILDQGCDQRLRRRWGWYAQVLEELGLSGRVDPST